MGKTARRRNARQTQPSCTSKLTCKTPTKASSHNARWSNLPEGPLLRMFEVMAGQHDGRSRVRQAQLVCRAWRTSAMEVVLGDTATSKPYRPPVQAGSDQAEPAATMNTCGAMMVGSNQSKEVSNDGVEVCSRPPQLKKAKASSSGNMAAAVQQTGDTEQAGSVEQPAPPLKHPGRLWKQDLPAARRSIHCAPQRLSSGSIPQTTRRVTRALAAAAAAADQTHAQPAQAPEQAATPAAGSMSERGQPTHTVEPAKDCDGDAAAESSEEVQGGHSPSSAQTRDTACQSSHGAEQETSHQHTPDQHLLQHGDAALGSQASPGGRGLEARVEGVQSIWSIFKRFSRRPQPEI